MPSTNENFPDLKKLVSAQLKKKKLDRPPAVADAIATAAAGYLEMQGGSLLPFFPEIPHDMLAEQMVLLYRGGEKPSPPTKKAHRPIFRGAIDGVLNGMNFPWPDLVVRETLTSMALGAWDENDVGAIKGAIASYIVSLYARGLD